MYKISLNKMTNQLNVDWRELKKWVEKGQSRLLLYSTGLKHNIITRRGRSNENQVPIKENNATY